MVDSGIYLSYCMGILYSVREDIMLTSSLNGPWQMQIAGDAVSYPAQVPGSVYADLLRSDAMEDPFYRDNEMTALALMENDFCYTRRFIVEDALLRHERVLLRCEGLDTLAEIRINDAFAGRADNMHRTWEFDVKSLLRAGENTIEITFSSPTRYIRAAYAQCKADGSSHAMQGFPHLRKAHCMFGWDWGPRLPDAGIWRDIALVGFTCA
ncbi:MAG: hypothetical protein PHO66_05085, partial [Eubacteriales bacterium]|nr:hypothetical protein [Eubacteriales bacterium]